MISRLAVQLFVLLAVMCATPSVYGLEAVTLQLKWKHAFQFAGYYMAKEKGFYSEAGLDVTIVEETSDVDPTQVVLNGKAQFGVGTSSLLLKRARGKPIVVLAVIFQQSPYVIFAAPNIQNMHQLLGKRIMIEPQADELLAFLKREGISPDQIDQIPHSYNADGLMEGKADAISGYISNEPFYFRKAHYPFQSFSPRSADIDFYGDNLFTSERHLRTHPKQVKAFRAASLRGWQYAKNHRDEAIDLILAKYSPQLSRDYLEFESAQMIPLLQPNLIEIGYMNPNRWQDIANTYADLGMMPRDFSLDGFIYDATEMDYVWFYTGFVLLSLIIAIVTVIALYINSLNRSLRASQKQGLKVLDALRDSEEKYRLLTENAKEVIWTLDPVTLNFLYVSPAVFKIRGYTPEEVMAETLDAALTEEGSATMKNAIVQDLHDIQSGKRSLDAFRTDELEQSCKDGTMIWTEVVTNYYLNNKTNQYEIRGVTRNITKRKRLEEEVRQLAFYDPLTNLPNRRLLNDRLIQAMATNKRKGCYGVVMFLDLDNFKPLNDTHGHIVGDLLLIEAASRLKHCIREMDIVARFGGDEFVVMLSELDADRSAATAQARSVAEKILAALSAPYRLTVNQNDQVPSTVEHHCTASMGVAMFHHHEGEHHDLLEWADAAMYQAKDAGRNQIQFYET